MYPGIYIGLSGSVVQEDKLNTITHNLANVNTPGYKKDVMGFSQYFLSALQYLQTDFSPAPLFPTKNPFDLALEGRGFFTISTPNGVRYTRRGDFMLDLQHQLVTKDGYPVLGKKGSIIVNGENFVVDTSGTIRVDGVPIDTLRIEDFPEGTLLKKEANGLFAPPLGVEPVPSKATVKQGYLESANVNVVEEMVNMIQTLRNYEACQKIIRSIDETVGKAVNEVGAIKI